MPKDKMTEFFEAADLFPTKNEIKTAFDATFTGDFPIVHLQQALT